MAQWTISQTSFDEFLDALDRDRERAGAKYEALRLRIVKFFEWRACRSPEDLADQTLDRIARKISVGEQIQDPVNYAYGVARFLYLETLKQKLREEPIETDIAFETAVDGDKEERMICLEACLTKLTETSRAMIVEYYCGERQAKIDHRKELAARFRISVNALRIKSLRIRATLEDCVTKCMNNGQTVKQIDTFYH